MVTYLGKVGFLCRWVAGQDADRKTFLCDGTRGHVTRCKLTRCRGTRPDYLTESSPDRCGKRVLHTPLEVFPRTGASPYARFRFPRSPRWGGVLDESNRSFLPGASFWDASLKGVCHIMVPDAP